MRTKFPSEVREKRSEKLMLEMVESHRLTSMWEQTLRRSKSAERFSIKRWVTDSLDLLDQRKIEKLGQLWSGSGMGLCTEGFWGIEQQFLKNYVAIVQQPSWDLLKINSCEPAMIPPQ